jgi:hypothetical protein
MARNAGSASLTLLGMLGLVTVTVSVFIMWLILSQPMSMMVAMSEREGATWIAVLRQVFDEAWVALRMFL